MRPISPDNLLAIMNGLLTGAPVTNCVNFSVCAKSPLTSIWNDSHCNGWWGTELQYAEYLGLLIKGRSQSPVYINIIDDGVEILDATDPWGMDTFEIQAELKKRHFTDRGARVLSIGPAGERPVTGAQLDAMLDEYYDAAGFTKEGLVPKSLLMELGI